MGFDEAGAVRILDEHRQLAGLTSLVGELVLPVMRQVGVAWEHGEVSVAQEHLATQLVRAYLDGLRTPGPDDGPQVWLACPPRELHDLPLLALGVLLRERGWRVRFFGASTPLHDLRVSARVYRPDVVVVSGDDPRRLRACEVALDLLAAETMLVLGGRAAEVAGASLPGRVLPPDVVAAAEDLVRTFASPASPRREPSPSG